MHLEDLSKPIFKRGAKVLYEKYIKVEYFSAKTKALCTKARPLSSVTCNNLLTPAIS